MGPEDEQLALNVRITTPAVSDGASNQANRGKLIVQIKGENGAPISGLLIKAVKRSSHKHELTGTTDQSGYHIFDHVSAGTYNLTVAPGGRLGKRVYPIPIEEGARREYIIDSSQGVDVTAHVSGPADPTQMELTLTSLAMGISVSKKADASGYVHFSKIPVGPGILTYNHPARYDSRREMQILIAETMEPLNITLPSGRIDGVIPTEIADLSQVGHVAVRKLGPIADFVRCDFDGRRFRAETLEDGPYRVSYTLNRRTLAESDTITIEDGEAVTDVQLVVDASAMPRDPGPDNFSGRRR